MGDGLTLSKQDEQRTTVLGQVGAGILWVVEAAALIGMSERQVQRWLVAYERGARGIVHGNRAPRSLREYCIGARVPACREAGRAGAEVKRGPTGD